MLELCVLVSVTIATRPNCLALTHHLFCFFLAHCQFAQNDHCKSTLHNSPMHMDNSPTTKIINVEINVDRAETKGRTEIFFGEGRN